MTKNLFLLTALFLACLTQAQDFSITLFATDTLGNKDSVIIGLNELATIGIDSELGESQVSSTITSPVDMRIILRTQDSAHCSQNYFYDNPINWEINADLKTDFRPYSSDNSFSFKNPSMVFEIKVYSTHLPCKIWGDYSDNFGYSLFCHWSAINLLQDSCQLIETKTLGWEYNEPIFEIDQNHSTLLIQFQHHVSVNDFQDKSLKVYPNPTKDIIFIESDFKISSNIYTLSGQLVHVSKENQINISALETGLYILDIRDDKNIPIQVELISKE